MGLGLLAVGALVYVYSVYNPIVSEYFPKCPIKHLTGLDCPGCGGQRSVHYLLNGEVKQAVMQNPLLFLLVPYMALGFYLQIVPGPTLNELKLRKFLYGHRAIQVLFVVLLLYTVIRNIV